MGVVPQLDNLDIALTVEQTLPMFAHLYGVEGPQREAIERALAIGNLADRRDTRVDKLSGGMRRRLLIARALRAPARSSSCSTSRRSASTRRSARSCGG